MVTAVSVVLTIIIGAITELLITAIIGGHILIIMCIRDMVMVDITAEEPEISDQDQIARVV